ncbi:MAG TPA: type II toxin-antitoxin system VapB family antitoxin [Promineifilum sp.]
MNIKNTEVERLVEEVIRLTGESKTEAIRKALDERRQRLLTETITPRTEARLLAFLEDEIWPQVPPEVLGKLFTKEDEEAILGYGNTGI